MGFRHYIRPGTRRRLLRGERVGWVHNRPRWRYIRQVILSAPEWVDRRDVDMLAAWASALTVFTGRVHCLDHIVPLTHPLVCGLTVPWNLQPSPIKANLSKGNRWNPDQMELFTTST